MAERFVGAIDLGSTRYRVGVVDDEGQVIERLEGSSSQPETGEELVSLMAADFNRVVQAVGRHRVPAAGASICGAIDSETRQVYPPNLRSVWGMNIEAELSARIGVPLVADNDANLGAVGELRFGAARGLHSIVYMTVSTGIGGGIIVNNRIITGAHGLAGEIGHIMVAPGGPRCGCGNYGCVEAVASGTGIARVARLRIASGQPSFMLDMADGDLEQITAATVSAAAAREDPLAVEIVKETGQALGKAVLSLIHVLDPQRIILGGGVMESSELYFPAVVKAVETNPYVPFRGKADVVLAALGEDVCLIGAAALALDSFQ